MKNNKNILFEQAGNKLPFSVPEDYFNQFALRIEDQIGYRKTHLHFLRSWMYMAAMFVGILVMSGIFYTKYQRNSLKNSENYESYVMAQVDETAVVDYYVNDSSNK
jgi:hypothetical protein